jgi:hypothetical protein
MIGRYILKLPALVDMSVEELAVAVAPTLQRYIDGPVDGIGSASEESKRLPDDDSCGPDQGQLAAWSTSVTATYNMPALATTANQSDRVTRAAHEVSQTQMEPESPQRQSG